jgi:hypothetical protein
MSFSTMHQYEILHILYPCKKVHSWLYLPFHGQKCFIAYIYDVIILIGKTESQVLSVSLLLFSNVFAPTLLNMETSTLMWSSISYELTFQRNMPRLMFRADNKVVLSEMKFIRWKQSCYSFQKSSVHRTERIQSCAQIKR